MKKNVYPSVMSTAFVAIFTATFASGCASQATGPAGDPKSQVLANEDTPTIFGDQPQSFLTYALDSSALSVTTQRSMISFELQNPYGEQWSTIEYNRASGVILFSEPVDSSISPPQLSKVMYQPGTQKHREVKLLLISYVQTIMQGNPWGEKPEYPQLKEAIDWLELQP